MNKYIFFLLLFSIKILYATENQTWIKLTCFGPTTPRFQTSSGEIKFTDLLNIYFIQNSSTLPSIEDLRNQNIDRFSNINNRCHNLRIKKMDLSKFPSNKKWLDWDTDYQYAGFKMTKEIYDPRVCRKELQPCLQSSDCCKTNLYCDSITSSCANKFAVSNDEPQKKEAPKTGPQ